MLRKLIEHAFVADRVDLNPTITQISHPPRGAHFACLGHGPFAEEHPLDVTLIRNPRATVTDIWLPEF